MKNLEDLRLEYVALSYIALRTKDVELSDAYLEGVHRVEDMIDHQNDVKDELDLSIEHWERLCKCKTREEIELEGWSSDYCHLCTNRLNEHKSVICSSSENPCPVFLRTRKNACLGTPYEDAVQAVYKFFRDRTKWSLENMHAACKEELEFLKGLKK